MEFKDITKKIINFGKNNASYWGNALAGETGEVCNLIKKFDRGDFVGGNMKEFHKKLGYELADVFNYLELTARFFYIDLEKAIIEKIDIVNKRVEVKE